MHKKTETKSVMKSVKIFSFFTSISRILGYVRSMVIAFEFGTGMIADVFFVAFPITLHNLQIC